MRGTLRDVNARALKSFAGSEDSLKPCVNPVETLLKLSRSLASRSDIPAFGRASRISFHLRERKFSYMGGVFIESVDYT